MEKIKVLGYEWDNDNTNSAAQSAKRLNEKINLWLGKQEKEIRLTKPPVVTCVVEGYLVIVLCYEETGKLAKPAVSKPQPRKAKK